MIEKVRIRGYRKYKDITISPVDGLNIIVGDNDAGKSTILEAINLALTGRVNGRPAQEELNPYWFNKELVDEFFENRSNGQHVEKPTISVEIFLFDTNELQGLVGANNSEEPTRALPGIELSIEPNPEYSSEIEVYFNSGATILPVEFYCIKWRSFAGYDLISRPKALSTAVIDSRTIRSSSGVDAHLKQMLSDNLSPQEKAQIATAYRSIKEQMTTQHLNSVNEKIKQLDDGLDDFPLTIAMDQSSKTSWDANVSPFANGLPFSMAGLGNQVKMKVTLAMNRSIGAAKIVMIEEPENHLSHTSLNKLVHRINATMEDGSQQVFITTHSSFVLNRLGLDSLLLVSKEQITTFSNIKPDTVDYFRKLSGYDTLRFVFAPKVVLVEGPSDEIVFERFYKDAYGNRPIEDGIDVICMRGLSLSKCLELAHALDKVCVVLRDNDGQDPQLIKSKLEAYLSEKRKLCVSESAAGKSLEPQILHANPTVDFHGLLTIQTSTDVVRWMQNNKTDAALRILDSSISIEPPSYFSEAMEFIHGA